MQVFRGERAAQQAQRHGAIRIANGLYLSEEPTPQQLARVISEQWPDCALDGKSAACKHLDEPLQFPLEVLRESSLPPSEYFTSRRPPERCAYLGWRQYLQPFTSRGNNAA